jgi:hypothetical protein
MADEQPRSKSTKVSGGRKSGQIIKRISYDPINSPLSYESEIPDLGDAHPYVSDLYFFDADFQPVEGGYADLTLNYSWIQNGVWESELRAQVQDVPLEKHPSYKLKWNYSLITPSYTQDKTVPSWWELLESVEDFAAEQKIAIDEYSIKTNTNALADGNVIIAAREKVSNSYKKPTIVVTERIYYNNLQGAKSEASEVGKIGIPRENFGYSVGDFLLTSAPIRRSGGYWMVDKTYEYSDEFQQDQGGRGWDEELYGREESE